MGDPHSNLDGAICEWCPDPAVAAIELRYKQGPGTVPSGQYVYHCRGHQDVAQRVVNAAAEGARKRGR